MFHFFLLFFLLPAKGTLGYFALVKFRHFVFEVFSASEAYVYEACAIRSLLCIAYAYEAYVAFTDH